MKTNFGRKSLLVLIPFISMFTAFINPSNADSLLSSSQKLEAQDTTSDFPIVYGVAGDKNDNRRGR